MKRVLGMMVGGLLLGLAGIAVAQTEETAGLVRPLVVSIEQAVPVELTLAVAQSDGAVVTMTAPITVEVGLQIRIDGDQVVAVAPAAAEAAAVAVKALPLVAPAMSEGFLIDDVVWSVTGVENTGSVFDNPDDVYQEMTTEAMFIAIEFQLENVGKAPTDIRSNVPIYLRDDQDRRFEIASGHYEDACFFVKMNPGLTTNCRLVYEVPPAAQGFELILGDVGVVPLTAE